MNVSYETSLDWSENWFAQQATFWTRPLWEKIMPIDESLHYAMDFALWLEMTKVTLPIELRKTLSIYRIHEAAKCVVQPAVASEEILRILKGQIEDTVGIGALKALVRGMENLHTQEILCLKAEMDSYKARLMQAQIELRSSHQQLNYLKLRFRRWKAASFGRSEKPGSRSSN